MSLSVKRITELPYLSGLLDSTEVFPIVHQNVTYKYSLGDLLNYFLSTGINRPPVSQNFEVDTDDTQLAVAGNLLAGAYDPDGDPLTFERLSYNGTDEPTDAGSFTTLYGVFFLNGDTGDWTYTLGVGARELNAGQIAHELFTYTLADGRGGISTSILTITIAGTNNAPVVNYVNDMTPINVTVQGNVIEHYAFDYETTPTVLHFVVDGISGTWTGGSSVPISGVGTITIDTNGDYTFVPVSDFTGPVPLITYTVTDGANNVDAFLTLAVTPLVPGIAPIALFTDIVSGPITGGENNKGTYLTIWGFRFGSPSGIGTTLKVYIGGVEVDNYRELIVDQLAARFPGMQRLCVQVGDLGLTLGKPYHITVQVNGIDSNADNIFTPNPGRIFFASLSGDNSTAVIGDIAHPFRTLQAPVRTDPAIYPLLRGGDTIVIRGGDWSELGYANCWFRFRDPQQFGSNPNGESETGWIAFMPYPGEDVHYSTPVGGNSGGIEGPGQAFTGTTGDWVVVSKLRMDVPGGSSGAAAPVNMQYNTGHWRIVGNNFGPWVAGDSAILNAACITGEGNFIDVLGNYCHDIEGTSDLQNHGLYAGTSSYGWRIAWNWFKNMTGGSHIQFNDSDGGTGIFVTPYGIWEGFTNNLIHNNFLEVAAKYSINFADIGNDTGDLSFRVYNNIIVGTNLPPMRLNTSTTTSDGIYAFNTMYDCMRQNSGTGNGYFRNEALQGDGVHAGHSMKAYDNLMSWGPNTIQTGFHWFIDYSGQSSGYDFKRNLYYGNTGGTPDAPATDTLAVIGDPLFTDPTTLDFSLQNSSPAANAGTQALPAGFNVFDDFTGQASREFGGAPDIGAMEIGQDTPFIITPPSFTGGPQVGVVTTVTLGSWGNAPTSYLRQFTVNNVSVGSPKSGTGSYTYTPVGDDATGLLQCQFTVDNAEGETIYVMTIGTVTAAVGAPVNTVLPAITGTAQVDSVLSCSTGTWTGSGISGYEYQWQRNTTNLSGATSNTYTCVVGDIGIELRCVVKAVDHTHGSASIPSNLTGAVIAAPADPELVQFKAHYLTTHANSPITMDDDVSSGNLILYIWVTWDQAAYNFNQNDSQGHVSSDWTLIDRFLIDGDNAQAIFGYLPSIADGAYTYTVDTDSGNGGSFVMMEITSTDPSTLIDIPQDSTWGSTADIALTASQATTKPTDLVFVCVSTRGTGHTVTPGTGWDAVTSIDGPDNGLFLFKRKESAIETISFTATLETDAYWGAGTFVVKGS